MSFSRGPSGRLAAVPPSPRTPSAAARELIFTFQGSQKVFLLVGVIFTLVGLGMLLPFCWQVPSDLAIAFGGHPAEGRVLSAGLDRSVTINGRHPTLVWFTYDQDGRRYEAHSSGLDARLRGLGPSDVIPIEVSEVHPSWARLAGTTRSWSGYFGLFILIFPGIGMIMGLAAVRSRRRAVRAFTYGMPAVARVTFFGPDTSTSINGRNPFKVDWEFRATDGKIYFGSLSSMSMLALEPLAQEGEIVVLHDPDDPRVNTVFVG